ncbi:MAG: DUF4252 domain-containing protein [bacterium]|nr:DUF4252 domain-containing protein [bacterium]
MRSRTFLYGLLLVLLLTGLAVVAAEEDLTRDPGFVNFSDLGLLTDDELNIHVSVKDPLLKLVAEATRENEPELADLLSQLKAIEVYVYTVNESLREAIWKEIRSKANDLEGRGWDPAITIRMRRERGYVFLNLVEGKPVGLAAMYIEDNEAVFVNIVGSIDPTKIGRVASRFNIDLLGDGAGDKD